MVRKLQYIVLFLAISVTVHAQEGISIDAQVWTNVRLATFYSGGDAGWNGGGLSVGIRKPLKNNFSARISGELGAAGIGNYVAVIAGIGMPIEMGATRWTYTPGFNVLQGMEMARPTPLYMWGLEQTNAIDLRLKKQSGPGLVIGFRIYGFPGYVRYSEVHSFFDLKAGLRYTF